MATRTTTLTEEDRGSDQTVLIIERRGTSTNVEVQIETTEGLRRVSLASPDLAAALTADDLAALHAQLDNLYGAGLTALGFV